MFNLEALKKIALSMESREGKYKTMNFTEEQKTVLILKCITFIMRT
jgi:hypothetical protein